MMKRQALAAQLVSLSTVAVLCLASRALAQPPGGSAEQAPRGPEAAEPRGWRGALTLGGTLNLIQSDNVVGQADAFTVLVGLSVAGQADYVEGPHELRNSLLLNLAWARTPAAVELVKSNDLVRAESLYHRRMLGRTGPYAHLGLITHLLPVEDVRPFPRPYLLERPDGTVEPLAPQRLRLSGALNPVTFTQTVGWLARPLESPALTWNVRLGAGARQTLLRGDTFVLLEREDTPEVDVVQVAPVFQAGVELATGLRGVLEEGRLGYELGASALVPLVSNDARGRTPLERVRLVTEARVNVAVLRWLTLSYQLLVVYDREFLDALQTQNNLLLRVQYTLGSSPQR
jgi:hypothetical protein